MVPRSYRMDKRRKNAEETRRRILDATLVLHARNGIFGTSYQDIARKADVSVATVYKHFPSLEELVPACGELVHALTQPPGLDDAQEIFRGAGPIEERIGRLVSTLYAAYERGEPYLEVDARERQMSMVRKWEAYMRSVREGLAGEALVAIRPNAQTIRAVSALLDFPVYKAFRRQDLSRRDAEEVLKSMLVCWIGTNLAAAEEPAVRGGKDP